MEKKANLKKILLIAIPAAAVVIAAIIAAVLIFGNKGEVYRLIRINGFEGGVSVYRSSLTMDAFDGMQLISEDTVEVGSEAFLELLADEDKHICAEENTGFTLISTGTSESGYLCVNLLYGKGLFTIDNKLGENSSFEVKTPNATLSVRGTSFSVEYDISAGETNVEVFEGTVWASHDGTEDILNAGDTIVLTGIDMAGTDLGGDDIPQLILPETSNDLPVFMLTHYFQNVPDYWNYTVTKLEYYPCETSVGEYMTLSLEGFDTDTMTPLEKSVYDVYSTYTAAPIGMVQFEDGNAILEAYADNGDYSCGGLYPKDVSVWFDDGGDHIISLNDGTAGERFAFSKVKLDWVYGEMSEENWQETASCFPSIKRGDRVYSLVGVTFTFYKNDGNAPLGAVADESNGGSGAELIEMAPIAMEITKTYRYYMLANSPDVEPGVEVLISSDSYNGGNNFGADFFVNDGLEPDPVSKLAVEIRDLYIKPHDAEIDAFFNANKDADLAAFETNGQCAYTDVTDWFPETITVYGSERDYICRIEKVQMNNHEDIVSVDDDFRPEFYPVGYYRNIGGEYFCYVGGVRFTVWGYIE